MSNKTPAIGRLIYVHPTCGELFYLRMLLSHQVGCQTFNDIKKIGEVIFPTYRATCEHLGLLGDDKEWTYAFDDASSWATAEELRSLFAHMLLFCDVANPVALWTEQWRRMSDDITQRAAADSHIVNLHVNEVDLQHYVLYELEILLNSISSSSSLCDYGLPMPPPHLLAELKNRLLMEERNYDRVSLTQQNEVMVSNLNSEQHIIYDTIMKASLQNHQVLMFVHGHGGTGKTFLWTTIISAFRSVGKIVLAVASSGIASLLLPSGRTAHSRFGIPLELTNESICYIKKNTQLARLLCETALIIWDEAPMADRNCFEAVDKTLKDILDEPTHPFGGKSVLLGGDFRQTLPVKRKGTRKDIIASSIAESLLWTHFKIGDGRLGVDDEDDPTDTKWVEIPEKYLIPDHEDALNDLVRFIYDEDILQNPTAAMFCDKAIVCPKNESADEINNFILCSLPGEPIVHLSVDSIIPHANDRGDTEVLYPSEYLNLLNFSGFPAHRLQLKVGVPIMLLRNMNQMEGLCNGTRMIITQLLPRLIQAEVITGVRIGHKVYIPRITLNHNDKELPFVFKRKQFPVRVCYAMTVNKSQGQSLKKIGIYLPQPIFSHGQLYVALSRATSSDGLKILIKRQQDQPSNCTKNIVFSDFLTKLEPAQGVEHGPSSSLN